MAVFIEKEKVKIIKVFYKRVLPNVFLLIS